MVNNLNKLVDFSHNNKKIILVLVCGDYSGYCTMVKYYKRMCDRRYVRYQCPRSCGVCTGNGKCENFMDTGYHCKENAMNGFCKSKSRWMKHRCTRTCCERGELY